MKDDLDMMFSRIEKDIERISEKYPAAGRKEKEKIYKISQQKYQQLKAMEESDEGFTIEASGVERYRRPMLYRGISAVAAALVLVSGLAGGLLLAKNSRIPNVDIDDSSNTSQSTMVNEIEEDKMNADVDVLVDNFEHIMRELYIADDGAESEIGVVFYRDAVNPETGEMYKKDFTYYKVTDEKLNDPEKIAKFMGATFASKLSSYYFFEGDLGAYEDGKDFSDDSKAGRRLRPFIAYNGVVLADHIDDDMSYKYKFHEVYDFSNYKLISSVFDDSTDAFNDELELDLAYPDYDESDMQSLVCSRIYQRDDGMLIYADFLLKEDVFGWKIANYNIMDEVEKRIDESNKDIEEKQTMAYENDDNTEFADLQLHEMKVCSNEEEAQELQSQLSYDMYNGTYPFKKVDREKYIQQIMNAESHNTLNCLENKSYIYHIMLNSFRYFDTADVTYTVSGDAEDGSRWSGTNHSIADNRNNNFYKEHEFIHDDYYDHTVFYQDNNEWIHVNEEHKTYFIEQSDVIDYNNIYLPDNYRYIFYIENEMLNDCCNFADYPMGAKEQECLYPSAIISDLVYFDQWIIRDVEERFGRECAVIYVENDSIDLEMVVDLRSGIVLESDLTNKSNNTSSTLIVKEIRIDTNLEFKHFDPTEYTNEDE